MVTRMRETSEFETLVWVALRRGEFMTVKEISLASGYAISRGHGTRVLLHRMHYSGELRRRDVRGRGFEFALAARRRGRVRLSANPEKRS